MAIFLKCKKCGKMFSQNSKGGELVSNTKKGCKGGCVRLVSVNWVEKKIDGESPK